MASSASDRIDQKYLNHAKELLQELFNIPNINLVFGAYNKGIMKVSYDEFKKANKKITGVLTKYHKRKEIDQTYTKEIVTETTTTRFEEIYKNSDILLFLPGGLGTLAELFSAIEERRIENKKRIILFNDNYYFTPIIRELYRMYKDGFIEEVPSDYMDIESDKNKIIEIIKKER